jgi:hypothetical protein
MAHQRTPGRVKLVAQGLQGFQRPGDAAYWKLDVQRAGYYDMQLFYTSAANATMQLSVGTHAQLAAGKGASVTVRLPKQVRAAKPA